MGEEEVDVIKINDNENDDDYVDIGVGVDNTKNRKQMVVYCKTFNLIDKGNVNGGSKTHKRTTKLLF